MDSQQKVFLYVPCQMDLFQAETVSSVITVLDRLGQFCHYDTESTCCGRRFFMEGEIQYAKELGAVTLTLADDTVYLLHRQALPSSLAYPAAAAS